MNDMSLLKLYKIAVKNLSKRRKVQLTFVLILMILNSFSELISIAILVPFFSTLLNINETYSKIPPYLKENIFTSSPESFLISFVLIISVICLLSGLIRMISLYSGYKLSALIANELVAKTYKNILDQEYSFFLKEEKSKLVAVLTNDGIRFLTQLILPTLNFINYVFFLVFMGSILVFFNWQISLSIFSIVLLMYGSVSIYAKKLWKRESKNQVMLLQEIVQKLSINFGSIEYIKLYDLEEKNFQNFRKTNYSFNNSLSKGDFVASSPRIFLEYLMIIVFICLSVYLVLINKLNEYLPVLITIIILAQKILPLIQKVYESLAMVSTTKESFANIIFYLNGYKDKQNIKDNLRIKKLPFLRFNELIFKNVFFKYKNQEIFRNINLNIKRGEKVAIIGESGNGKTTLMRMILGLLSPSRGEIIINGEQLNKQDKLFKKIWQNIIGYVSQDIYLVKGSMKSNITFFEKYPEKDDAFINKIIRMSSLENCVKKHGGIYSEVNEAGVGFSGGEKQRIAIARALYKSDQILIMDEPTSSLDIKMKNKILRNILKLKDLTFICVLHDFENLNEFDKVIKCSNKKLEVITN